MFILTNNKTMKPYEEKKFNIGELKGISQKNIEEHLKLYSGYVKNTNLILEKLEEVAKNPDPSTSSGSANAYALAEMQRRFSFEYNGMRNHEIYFDLLSDGPEKISEDSELFKSLTYLWGSFDKWLSSFKALAMTRGVGWAILYYDRKEKRLLNAWIDEQHLGQLQDCTPILALDMWEHSFVYDYQPSGKKQYIEDFFENLNWGKTVDRLNEVV